MIKELFETNRPIFFITDKDKFNACSFGLSGMDDDIPFSSTENTVSIFCLPVFDEGDSNFNEVFIYVNEHPAKDEINNFSPIFNGRLSIPSKTIKIVESDDFLIFEKSFETAVINLTVFIEKDYAGDAPSKFIVIINDKNLFTF